MSKARGFGYIFKSKVGEEVRIMNRNGGWDMRIRNQGGGWLDEFGNQATGPAAAHGINVFSK